MADIKVSALNELTSADANDLLLVTDTSAVESKYIQKGNITEQNFTTTLKSKLDGIEASADVTDTANVTAAGAVMDSELTDEAAVKALDQGVATTDSPTFVDLTVDSVQLTGGTGDQGTISWNDGEETLDIILNGSTLQVGQEIQYHCKNSTGSTIADGTPVMVAGTDGVSGHILITPMVGSSAANAKRFIGITTEEITNGDYGKVSCFGKVRGLDTTGPGAETWSDGDILWVNPTTTGVLTNVTPSSGQMAMAVGYVIAAHATNGILFVRVNNLNENEFLDYDSNLQAFVTAFTLPTADGSTNQVLTTNGSGTLSWATVSGSGTLDLNGLTDVSITSPVDGQSLVYDGTNWVNEAVAGGGAIAIDDISDIVITTPADNEVLAYDSTSGDWINQTAAEAGLATTTALNAHINDDTNPHSVTATQVGLGNVENTALSTWAGTSNITTLGTITTGTWNGTAIGDSYISSATNWNTAYGWGDHSLAGYLTSFTETNDLTAAVTWANVPDANITQTSVTQHQAALSITESQISDLQSYLTSYTETDPVVGAVSGIVKANGAGTISAAVAGTDYLVPSAIANMLETSDIGVTVQGYDADTMKTDVAQTMTAQLTVKETAETAYNLTGTDVDPANGTMQYKTVSGSVTLTGTNFASGQSVTVTLSAATSATFTGFTWVGAGSVPTLIGTEDTFVMWMDQDSNKFVAHVGGSSGTGAATT